ncbi:MAG: hypothetical protein NHB15_19670 [Methanosarcina barkeri]|nr:hypothetical protein [Methanosarcina sp. ERenArc_MAG2]
MQERDEFKTFVIREATSKDVHEMLEIFNYYVENSFAAYLETPVGPDFSRIFMIRVDRTKMSIFLFM